MIVGIVKELKENENRVGLPPYFVSKLTQEGNKVLVESMAGVGSGFSDEEYLVAGATIASSNRDVYAKSDMIVKIKEPQKQEYDLFRENQVIFSYLNLATTPDLANALISSKAIGIAYETLTNSEGRLPLLEPMSAIAGRMSILIGASLLQKQYGGYGALATGIPGVLPSKIVILGGGNVGRNAAFVACGIGANVVVLDNNSTALQKIDDTFKGKVNTLYSNKKNIIDSIGNADIVVGATHVAGSSAQKLITRDMLKIMKKGAVIIDISINQGGCCETSRPTTHANPCYEIDGIIHYCVPNMPGAYPQTSTAALTEATYPYISKIAKLGYEKAIKSDESIRSGVNTYSGNITCEDVATSLNRIYINSRDLI